MDSTTPKLIVQTRLEFRRVPGIFGYNYTIHDLYLGNKEIGIITSNGSTTLEVEYNDQLANVDRSTSSRVTVKNESTKRAIRLLAASDASEPAWLFKKEKEKENV